MESRKLFVAFLLGFVSVAFAGDAYETVPTDPYASPSTDDYTPADPEDYDATPAGDYSAVVGDTYIPNPKDYTVPAVKGGDPPYTGVPIDPEYVAPAVIYGTSYGDNNQLTILWAKVWKAVHYNMYVLKKIEDYRDEITLAVNKLSQKVFAWCRSKRNSENDSVVVNLLTCR